MLDEKDLRDLKRRFTICDTNTNIPKGIWDGLERYVVPYRGEMFQKESGECSVNWDKYKRMQVSGEEFRNTPDKNKYSHIAESLQYLALGMGKGYDV